jgi:hypothetical protein
MNKSERDLLAENARLKTRVLVLEANVAALESRLGLRPKSKLVPEHIYDRHPIISKLHDETVHALRRIRER